MGLATINRTLRMAVRSKLPLIFRSYIKLKDIGIDSTFVRIYETNGWGGTSRSGPGSDLSETAAIRKQLPLVMIKLSIHSLLDIPCGDYNWMQHVDLGSAKYIGADIVPRLIDKDTTMYATVDRQFKVLDLTRDRLPTVDLILCRDCLVHLSNKLVSRALRNIKASGSTFMLATTFRGTTHNVDIPTGHWRPLNLTLPPFGLPEPDLLIDEGHPTYLDKSLGLWSINKVPHL